MRRSLTRTRALAFFAALLGASLLAARAPAESGPGNDVDSDSALSDEVVPLQVDGVPKRPRPLLELGPPFLGTGPIGPGFRLPTGAWWQPQLLVWGSLRSAVQAFDPEGDSATRVAEWRTRWDIFSELEVSPTERIVVGLRPLDDNGRRFSGCNFGERATLGGPAHSCKAFWNGKLQALFAEGNVGEIFPKLGRGESRALDIEFGVGRQPLLFQDGMLIADNRIDAAAVTRNNIGLHGTTNTRVTALFAWNEIDRGDTLEDRDALLAGLMIETDTAWSTINFDTVVVPSDAATGTSIHGGLSFIQRLGVFSTAFRGLYSYNFDGDSAAASTGGLLFGELTYLPTGTHNNLYLNGFFGIAQFSSAARSPDSGGPLGNTGILFGAVGLGSYGAPLGSDVDSSFGGALGYQMFFANDRRWLVVEIGARGRYEESGARPAYGAGFSLQQAVGRRVVLRADGFLAHRERADLGWGARSEILIKY